MTATLLLRLAGPMQAWGESSRFTRRTTEAAPTKSGIVGMLAAAKGLRRTDPLEDLLTLRIGVRIDQPGRVERDFQTARTFDGSRAFPLTDRFYLTDAVFVAAVEGDAALIEGLDEAVRRPTFPLYLGRRSCPPSGPIALGVRETGAWDALQREPWHASSWWRRRQPSPLDLELRIDAAASPPGAAVIRHSVHRDEPESFDPAMREYGWRRVAHATVRIEHDESTHARNEPLAALGGT